MEKVRVRFAPSPTGNLHIGSVRTALFNWLYARSMGGEYILRIEDTDLVRSKKEYEQNILEGLDWLGLDWDGGPGKENGVFYRQTERIEAGIYTPYIKQLIDSGDAYYCYCTSEELEAQREQSKSGYDGKCRNLSSGDIEAYEKEGRSKVVRFKMKHETVVVNDLIRGRVEFDASLIPDFVVQKSDGAPAYNFAVVVDDVTMGMTHVVRGEDHLNNTPKQIQVYKALGQQVPVFAHMPMILGPDRSKLSKRHGATSVVDYEKQGYLPEALVNYLALLGWSHPEGKEICPVEEIIEKFDINRMSKSGAIFDVEKLKWVNGQYIRSKSDSELVALVKPFIEIQTALSDDQLEFILSVIKEKLSLLVDINDAIKPFVCAPYYSEKDLDKFVRIDLTKSILTQMKNDLDSIEWSIEALEALIESYPGKFECGKGKVLRPIRIAVTGMGGGPSLFELLYFLGKEEIVKRITEFI